MMRRTIKEYVSYLSRCVGKTSNSSGNYISNSGCDLISSGKLDSKGKTKLSGLSAEK